MTAIVERPLRRYIALETFKASSNPFVLGTSWLGSTATLGSPTSTIIWDEHGDDLVRVRIQRGGIREGITIRNRVGMLTVTIQDMRLDPLDPQFVKDQPVRFSIVLDGIKHPLFTGRVRDLSTVGVRNGNRVVPQTTIVAVDAVASHDSVTRYGAIPPAGGETFPDRIRRLQQTSTEPVEIPADLYPTPSQPARLLGRTVYESSLSNHFTLACNTVGAMWYVDVNGVTRFVPRVHDYPSTILLTSFSNTWVPWPEGSLKVIALTAAAGQMNAPVVRNKSVVEDPNNPGNWLDAETIYSEAPALPSVAVIGRRPVELEMNSELGYVNQAAHRWIDPYAYGWESITETARWNAQENLSRVPDLDIGASVTVPREPLSYGATWGDYLIIGLNHEITPTRWMVDLTLIGAYDQL